MKQKWSIAALLCLLFANSVLGGASGLWLCLHAAGEVHISEQDAPEHCCHIDEHQCVSNCDDCNDVKLDGVELLTVRDSETVLPDYCAVELGQVILPTYQWYTEQAVSNVQTRAPPVHVGTGLLVAKTIVLRT